MFQPSHSPESNPIEQVWQYLKRGLRWKLPNDLDKLRVLISQKLEEMSQELIQLLDEAIFLKLYLSSVFKELV